MIARTCRTLMLVAWCAVASPAPLDESTVQRTGLSAAQARQVLRVVLRHERFPVGKAGFYIETLASGNRGYREFGVTFESPQAAATTVLGAFAVSRMTGDVWETNLCKRYAFPELEQLQARIMKRTHQTFATEVGERRKLGCSDE